MEPSKPGKTANNAKDTGETRETEDHEHHEGNLQSSKQKGIHKTPYLTNLITI